MQMCPSWPKEHDWKSCNALPSIQEFESLHLRHLKAKILPAKTPDCSGVSQFERAIL